MNIQLNQDGLCMKRNQVVTVRGGVGYSILCDSGTVWVTQGGDPRDIILRAGESFTFDTAGTALVQAFEQSAISIARAALPAHATLPAARARRALGVFGLLRGAVRI